MADTAVDTWKKRIDAAKDLKDSWIKENRVKECLNYYNGEQLSQPLNATA